MHYRKGYTMVLSILHRITGVAMTVGSVLFVYWLVAAASGPQRYAEAQAVFSCVWVQLAIVGWIFSFCYHFLNGIRHLVWDAGYGFDLTVSRNSGYAVFVGAVLFTALICVLFLARTGGAA
jgi:succinate dehydrogenase / fumarate reductase cytochrome b subunit